jgi:hypothetical protein
MAESKLFTQQELDELGTQTVDLIQIAIDKDDKERAKALTLRMHEEFSAMHNGLLRWITSLLSSIGRRYSDEMLETMLRESCPAIIIDAAIELAKIPQDDHRTRVELMVKGLQGHLSPMKIEEDDEKFTIEMQPCGSGGRLILDGYYDPPHSYLKISKPQPMTFGKEDFPVYCTHCAILGMLGIEFGAPLFLIDPSDRLDEKPCKIYLYKDVNAIPEALYTKLGKKK